MLPENAAVILKPELIYSPVANYAMQQNHVPVVRKLSIKNDTEVAWQDVLITLSIEPDFASPWQHRIEAIPVGSTIELDAVRINIRPQTLAELTERIAGSLTLKITSGETCLFEAEYPLDILAYDQWNGIGALPEMLAAFITPNHPEIPKIIRRASVILEGWTGNPSFDEYQSRNPDRLRKQMAAIYEAIAEHQILYCSVPASFEDHGQRVRLADAIFSQKMGNCLDMSLLYAACMEAVGIHPLIIITKGHAFTGAWLIDESFADPVSDDPSLLTKRNASGINEIALVEATCMNSGKAASFDDAVRAASQHLIDLSEFGLFVDVKRARFSRIRPLPLRIATAGGFQIVEEEATNQRATDAPLSLSETLVLTEGTARATGKQQLWERKLLDLTLRNNLLNLRVNKGTIQFISINAAKLEDALAGGQEFQVLPKPADWDNPLRSAGLYQAVHAADPMLELVQHELTQKRLRSYLSETELTANLTNLYRSSRVAIEENGASTLYIALGFLKWFEAAASEAPRFAPILLLPVEIIRKSARQGFVIRSREEEPMMNITLLEKLRQDFGISISGLETLPRDESGVDVPAIFNIMRRAIMAQSRWDVDEQIVLGTFSFNKFILWNDIHNNAPQLLRNKTVASLVSGKLEWEVLPETPRVLDDAFSPSAVALPIASDSSQLEAIISSGEGKSFVLHGPPGTGKSQTITNIIANALYAGKKVLFVAAKKAALDVVESRLESIGIGPFCLELHSNKAKKTAIIAQLKAATEVVRKISPAGYEAEAARLSALRGELNNYVTALHRQWPFGFSLFEAFSRYSGEDEIVAGVRSSQSTITTLTTDRLVEWDDAIGELSIVAGIIGKPAEHPLQGISAAQYSPQLKSDAADALRRHADVLQRLAAATGKAASLLCIDDGAGTPEKTEALAGLATSILSLPDTPASMLRADSPEQTFARMKELTVHGRKRDEIETLLLQTFNKGVLNFDTERLLPEWNTASAQWFFPRWMAQNKIIKALKAFAVAAFDKAQVPHLLQSIINWKGESAILEKASEARSVSGFLWNEETCNWSAIDAAADALLASNRVVLKLTGPSGLAQWRQAFAASIGDSTGTFITAHGKALESFLKLHSEFKQSHSSLQSLLGISKEEGRAAAGWMQEASGTTARWLANIDRLKDWTTWTSAKATATRLGLNAIVSAYESGSVAATEIGTAYRKGLYQACAEYILGQSPQLASFNSALFEGQITRFKGVSESFEKLTREELYARLAARIPDFSHEASQSSEVGILQKAIRSNGRAMSILKLFDSIPNLIPRLMPCMLMSPISVAQYFDASAPKFDLVIFDEASQMPTCEAVGAIARGTSVIVVGDPKQMPPTSFFANNNVDEENLEQEDLESILDDCLALSMPSRHLLWHYRSKHESLIAFSNAKYYDNKLLTFPSTDDLATKVTHVYVPGFYDKGKTRQNKAEAQAIVAEMLRRLSNIQLAKRSMGVVTFSSVQQNLIEDLLTEEFKKAPHLEKIALEAEEPLFIKNLENVQGDERDVILFSVCYGPDEAGKVSLNFGPLNREGGWRRLNVAVSRARYEMKVFATLRADGIDLARTSAEGVAGLKAFLAYAEKGKVALPVKAAGNRASGEGLEAKIAEAIRSKGYEVHLNIGCSGYKVDMAVVHPEKPSEYLLGIICDGYNYNLAKTARDREVVQGSVLQALGWKLHRVWSPDWWEKREQVLDGIISAIKSAKTSPEEAAPAEAMMPGATTPEPLNEDLAVRELVLNKAATQPLRASSAVTFYEVCKLEDVAKGLTDFILLPQGKDILVNQINSVLTLEAPISKALLYRRVLAAWGIGRAGSRIVVHLDGIILSRGVRQTQNGKQSILWNSTQHPDNYRHYRVAQAEVEKRDAEDLPPEEIAAAVKEILSRQLSLPRAELIRECARLFGYARMGSKVEEAMGIGVDWAVKAQLVVLKDGRIIYIE